MSLNDLHPQMYRNHWTKERILDALEHVSENSDQVLPCTIESLSFLSGELLRRKFLQKVEEDVFMHTRFQYVPEKSMWKLIPSGIDGITQKDVDAWIAEDLLDHGEI